MADQTTKIDDKTFQVITTPDPVQVLEVYNIDDLKQQIINSQALEDEYVAARQGERATLQALIDKAAGVGIKPAAIAADAQPVII